MPVVLSMQFGFYIKSHRWQHGFVPMPLRFLVQHFQHIILLTGRGLAETLSLIGGIARGKQMTVDSARDRPGWKSAGAGRACMCAVIASCSCDFLV